MLVVSYFIISSIGFIANNYMFSKLIDEEMKIRNFKFIICLILLGIISCVISTVGLGYMSTYIIHICLFLSLKFLYRKSFGTTIIGIIGITIIIFFTELIISLLLIMFKVDLNNITSNIFYSLIINFIIYLIGTFLCQIKLINKPLKKVIKWYDKKSYRDSIIVFILILSINIFLLYINFIKILPSYLFWLTNLFCIGVFVFIIGYFIEKSNNNKLKDDYQKLMEYTKTYEELLDEKNKNQHEYKNQLVLISDMNSVKKVKEYINKLIDTEDENVEYDWINKIKYLPTGGIKGLIYYKIKTMIQKKITPCVDISKEIDNKKIWKTCNDNLKDISMILGVFIDNAIEAAVECDKKSVIIEAYLEGKEIVYSISNTYKEINIKKIDKEGYTTKGKGHGYGLPVVKDIISKNENLRIAREINGDYYISKLYIKK